MRATKGAGLVLACALGLALCGAPGAGAAGSGPAAPTAALAGASATKQVTNLFATLFNFNDKDLKAKEKLVEDPAKYKAKFLELFTSSVAKSNPVVAQVTAVAFPSAAACQAAVKSSVCASVTYNLDTATTGASVLTHQSGYAVRVGGHWLVADVTFCALASLAGQKC